MCWGLNNFGQLGNPNRDKQNTSWSPLQVQNLQSEVIQLSAGVFHVCALLSSGKVVCWGSNFYGQLGNYTNSGTTTPNFSPLFVQGIKTKVKQITAGAYHTCALLENGSINCWGRNKYGQLGNVIYSGTETNVDFPLPVDLSKKKALEITGGWGHTCVITEDHLIKCWGSNLNGQLGNEQNIGTDTPNPTPLQMQNFDKSAVHIASGDNYTCTTLSDEEVYCWGDNGVGQLGNRNSKNKITPRPLKVEYLSDKVNKVYIGSSNSCALLKNGLVECWGANNYGQLGSIGDPSGMPVTNPYLDANTTGLVVGLAYICALNQTGNLKCWGMNTSGELGVPTNYHKIDPNPYPLSVYLPSKTVIRGMEHSLGSHTCVIVN
ncbi:MAG: hypothetical protein JJT82_01740 [Legionellaceae bacterium]|nr:hypothetical protein [Legionellaceae bacterium]